MNEMFEALVE